MVGLDGGVGNSAFAFGAREKKERPRDATFRERIRKPKSVFMAGIERGPLSQYLQPLAFD
jgi:hypothetical protein